MDKVNLVTSISPRAFWNQDTTASKWVDEEQGRPEKCKPIPEEVLVQQFSCSPRIFKKFSCLLKKLVLSRTTREYIPNIHGSQKKLPQVT